VFQSAHSSIFAFSEFLFAWPPAPVIYFVGRTIMSS